MTQRYLEAGENQHILPKNVTKTYLNQAPLHYISIKKDIWVYSVKISASSF